MPRHNEEARTYTELMRQHGFFIPDTGDTEADYRRMEDIALMIGKIRRQRGLPAEPCPSCGQRKSGCWTSPDGTEQMCVNQPSSVDFGEEGDDSDW